MIEYDQVDRVKTVWWETNSLQFMDDIWSLTSFGVYHPIIFDFYYFGPIASLKFKLRMGKESHGYKYNAKK